MKCIYCGHTNPDNATKCKYCKAAIRPKKNKKNKEK